MVHHDPKSEHCPTTPTVHMFNAFTPRFLDDLMLCISGGPLIDDCFQLSQNLSHLSIVFSSTSKKGSAFFGEKGASPQPQMLYHKSSMPYTMARGRVTRSCGTIRRFGASVFERATCRIQIDPDCVEEVLARWKSTDQYFTEAPNSLKLQRMLEVGDPFQQLIP
jgi:hypothetical protein